MGKGKRPVSYEDIEALPPGWIGEIVCDELVAQPRPAMGHQRAAWVLSIVLGQTFSEGTSERGGWWIFYEPEIHLGRDVLVPDLAAWRKERLPRLPGPQVPWMTLGPDWVCEVLSPSTASIDRGRKMDVYHREGVSIAWLIDPLEHTFDVFHRHASGWKRTASHSGSEVVRAEPFDALPLELGKLWLPREAVSYVPTAGKP